MMSAGPVVLVVEDEESVRTGVRAALRRAEYSVIEAATGTEAERLAQSHNPELVLLDLGLPDKDGLTVIAALRYWTEAPILVLSARSGELEKVRALEGGADDYLTKPFGLDELLARLRCARRWAARRHETRGRSAIEVGDLRLELDRWRPEQAGREITLSRIQFRLLFALIENAGRVVSYEELLRRAWGPHYTSRRSLHVALATLRDRIGDRTMWPRYIVNERGIGYRFIVE